MAPGLTGAKIDHYDTVAALRRGVGDVGYAFAGGSDVWAEIEADVVDVLVGLSARPSCVGIGKPTESEKATFGGNTMVVKMLSF